MVDEFLRKMKGCCDGLESGEREELWCVMYVCGGWSQRKSKDTNTRLLCDIIDIIDV
jgi:hypothetical protein